MRFSEFMNESTLEDAKALQWNQDITEIYKWIKSLNNDKLTITYRKQNDRNVIISYKSEENEYPILDLEDIFLTPDVVRQLEADDEPIESKLTFVEYSIELQELKYTKNYTLKLKQWKDTELKKLNITDLKKKISDSIKQVEKFVKKGL